MVLSRMCTTDPQISPFSSSNPKMVTLSQIDPLAAAKIYSLPVLQFPLFNASKMSLSFLPNLFKSYYQLQGMVMHASKAST